MLCDMKTMPNVGDYVKVKGSYISMSGKDFVYGRVKRIDGEYIYIEYHDERFNGWTCDKFV